MQAKQTGAFNLIVCFDFVPTLHQVSSIFRELIGHKSRPSSASLVSRRPCPYRHSEWAWVETLIFLDNLAGFTSVA
jgi:hypothetical protein